MRNRNQVVLPLEIGIKIGGNEPVRKVVEICEQLDYTELNKAYLRKWRKVNPITLFIILVYAYMIRKYSSREIEEACRTDIRFMWILQDEPVPDHATIARFQNEKLAPVIESLFYQFIGKLMEMEEISYKTVFVDGTKIEANANRYTFVWAKAIEKRLGKLTAKTAENILEISKRYGLREDLNLEACLSELKKISEVLQLRLVYGKGQRKNQLQRDIEMLENCLAKRNEYLESIGKFKGRKSYSKTDVDATFMKLKEDHMKNGQLKAAYNVQIMAESEYIVGLGLFANPTDTRTLIPFLERVYRYSQKRIENVVADAGYESEENYTYLEKTGQKAYIKPSNYESQKKRKKNIYKAENMEYDADGDFYVCPNGKRLVYTETIVKNNSSGYPSSKKVYRCEEGCSCCPHRDKCFSKKSEVKEMKISKEFDRQRAASLENISTEEGILLRVNRSIQVEGAFGVLKQDFGFRRFLTRGKLKTEAQFFLLAFAFNIQKLHNRINEGRFGKSLFELSGANL